ncbi:MAG TPA: glycosyltransferase [Roseiflexaceae bacterium]|nr:glycosyltransferase [Roseiflexaceae bacterium]
MRNESNQHIQPRIMMYSQDGFGLGHMRRTSSIANQIAEMRSDAAILTMADSRLGQFFETSANHDYLKLPSILKAGPGDWRAVSLPLPFAEVSAMRREMIRSAVLTYQPHVLLVDHMPHGAMGELIPTLEALRAAGWPTRIVLGLRDILDAPEVVRRRWEVEGAYDAIERYYDTVLVYGKREVFDLAEQYGFSSSVAERLRYTGYVCTPQAPRYTARARAKYIPGSDGETKLIVAMAGGGADAYPMMRALLEALPAIAARQKVFLAVVTGPFMPAEQRRDLEARAKGLPARVSLSVNDTLSYIEAADLTIAMAGYNTTMEILRSGKRAFLIPRRGPSAEQRMRARLFAAQGWVEMIDPDDLDIANVAAQVCDALARGPRMNASQRPDMQGLMTAADTLLDMIGQPAEPLESLILEPITPLLRLPIAA